MTTQSEDPNERVDHPRAYNAHPSGIECIDLIEHLPANLANAIKYIWRCGLKQTETPLQELKKARWYTEREIRRIELYELDDEPKPKTDVVWRSLAHKVIEKESDNSDEPCFSTLAVYLSSLLDGDLDEMCLALNHAIKELEEK